MKTRLALCLLTGALAGLNAPAQIYVTPKMGGGQVAADMVHIDIYYDSAANQLHANVDHSYGTPELRALAPGEAFDPQASYAMLNSKAYNAQYGWNAGGFFTVPPGAAIWMEQTHCTPGLEVYADWGRYGTYAPIFGTGGSDRLWRWSGVMVHNTYAVLNPVTGRWFADYHIYFGDVNTGSRAGFESYDDASVRLEWTTVPVEDPMTFKFGAVALTEAAPLSFLNACSFATNCEFVMNLQATNAGPAGLQFERSFPMKAVAATATNGGPVTNHAALGSCLELRVESFTGPSDAQLGFWEPGATSPQFSLHSGAADCTNRFRLSENRGAPGSDPFGCIAGRRFTVNRPGLYCLGFRVVDTSTNGAAGGPIHASSEVYRVYLQAALTIASLRVEGQVATARFGGEAGKDFCLERSPALGAAAQWQTVSGPLPGSNRTQTMTDSTASSPHAFYRLRTQPP